jgi:hypothetical protein
MLTYQTKSGSVVYVFFLDDPLGILQGVELTCQSFFGSQNTPEMDSYMWVTKHDAMKMVEINTRT